jgi:phage anti-repressor protein
MKNLKTFSEFVNESKLNEGTMAAKAFKNEDLYDAGNLENAWDQESDWKSFADVVIKKLGAKSAADVIQADENSEEETDLGGKIYGFLQDKFRSTESIKNDLGIEAEYDAKLNVVYTADMGFIAYQFVANSKF